MNTRKSLFVLVLALAASVLSACGGGSGDGGGGGFNPPTNPTATVEASMSPTPNSACGTASNPGSARAGEKLMFDGNVKLSTATVTMLVEYEGGDGISATRSPIIINAGQNIPFSIGLTFNTPGTLARVFPRVDSIGAVGAKTDCWIRVR